MIEIKKLGYSRKPWRLVDSETGGEVGWMGVYPGLEHLGPVWMSGFDTKQAAIDGMGKMLAEALKRLPENL